MELLEYIAKHYYKDLPIILVYNACFFFFDGRKSGKRELAKQALLGICIMSITYITSYILRYYFNYNDAMVYEMYIFASIFGLFLFYIAIKFCFYATEKVPIYNDRYNNKPKINIKRLCYNTTGYLVKPIEMQLISHSNKILDSEKFSKK